MRRLALALLLLGCDADPVLDAGARDAAAPDAGAAAAQPRLRDEAGGALVLRGTNVEGAAKWAPDFLPPHYATTADFTPLVDELGMNAVRLLIFWEAIEPERGVYDDAYLAEIRARVEAAGQAGLHVIVDMHQDVFGRGFGHDGAPRWACDEALYASFEPPDEWYLGYAAPEVMECFDRLWLDADTRGAFAAAWARVAEALAGAEGLFAYELLNEPHWGTSSVRSFEREVAPAAYAEWIDAIRAADPETRVMMGPASAANLGLSSNLAPPDRPRLIYGPHLYPADLERGFGWGGNEASVRALGQTIVDDASRMGLPVIVGETGARPDVEGALLFLGQVYGAFDHHQLSVTQWEGGWGDESSYSVFDEAGAPSSVGRAIARPFPARTAGEPLRWSWDGSRFELEWREDATVSGDTVVMLPGVAFPDGADVTIDDGGPSRIEGARLIVSPASGERRLVVTRR